MHAYCPETEEPTAYADWVAERMRAYYEANRPKSWLARRRERYELSAGCADDLMLELQFIARRYCNQCMQHHAQARIDARLIAAVEALQSVADASEHCGYGKPLFHVQQIAREAIAKATQP